MSLQTQTLELPKDVMDPSFYLKRNEDGVLHLSHTYWYYYQRTINMRKRVLWLYLLDSSWNPRGTYFSESIRGSATTIFLKVILQLLHELTGRTCREGGSSNTLTDTSTTNTVLSQSCDSISSCSTSHQVATYCWCGGEDVGRMVACDNPNCSIEWFYFECVGIIRKPRGKWFCSNTCREQKKVMNPRHACAAGLR